jgi:acetolactate decarboxylase
MPPLQRHHLLRPAFFLTFFLSAVCLSPSVLAEGRLFQLGTLSALSAGVYQGTLPMSGLRLPHAYGLGTFDRLDGEMIVVDGAFYRVSVEGQVTRPQDDALVPFACVGSLDRPDFAKKTGQLKSKADFDRYVLSKTRKPNYPLLIVFQGRFSSVRTRSVPPQKKPIPLAEVVARQQKTFDLGAQEGTLVGFYCPPYLGGLNAPGVHLHFINEPRDAGGHVLDFAIQEGTLRVQVLTDFQTILPGLKSDFDKTDLNPPQAVKKVAGE